jgi:hypothetical protein
MPRHRLSFWLTFVAWLVLLDAIGVAVAYMKWRGRAERAARAQYENSSKAAWARGEFQRDRISALKAPGLSRMLTRDDLLAAVPQAKAARSVFTEMPDGSTHERLIYVDPQSFWHFDFTLDRGRWTGYSIHSGAPPPPKMPPPIPLLAPLLDNRKTLLRGTLVGWLVLVLAGVSLRRYDASVPLMHAALAVAVVYVGLAEAHPGHGLLSFSNDDLWIGLFGVLVSVLLYLVARREAAARRRELLNNRICLQCGYDLRASSERCPECGTPVPAVV